MVTPRTIPTRPRNNQPQKMARRPCGIFFLLEPRHRATTMPRMRSTVTFSRSTCRFLSPRVRQPSPSIATTRCATASPPFDPLITMTSPGLGWRSLARSTSRRSPGLRSGDMLFPRCINTRTPTSALEERATNALSCSPFLNTASTTFVRPVFRRIHDPKSCSFILARTRVNRFAVLPFIRHFRPGFYRLHPVFSLPYRSTHHPIPTPFIICRDIIGG